LGTRTGNMIRRCQETGLPEFEFSLSDGFVVTLRRKAAGIFKASIGRITGEVTDELRRLLLAIRGEMKRVDLQAALGLKHQESFRNVGPAFLCPWEARSFSQASILAAVNSAMGMSPNSGRMPASMTSRQ